jgi:ParB-like chromosome segregation protein Spo0J
MARHYENILLDGIHIEDGRLPLEPLHVDRLMQSIKEVGLLEPIIVCRRSRKSPAVVLVAGRNRLEACKLLKHETIAAIVENDESDEMDRWRELAEIDENLIRRELTTAQFVKLIARRKKIYEEAHPETKNGAVGGGRKQVRQVGEPAAERFTADTAKKTGKSERAVQRDAARGEALAGDLDKIAGTSLDKGVELDALAKMTPEQRAPLIERAAAGQDVSAIKEALDTGQDGTKPKLSEPSQAEPSDTVQSPFTGQTIERAVIKQAGAFHTELVEWSQDFRTRVQAWHAAHPVLDDESKFCVMQALDMLDMAAQEFFAVSQALDGR